MTRELATDRDAANERLAKKLRIDRGITSSAKETRSNFATTRNS